MLYLPIFFTYWLTTGFCQSNLELFTSLNEAVYVHLHPHLGRNIVFSANKPPPFKEKEKMLQSKKKQIKSRETEKEVSLETCSVEGRDSPAERMASNRVVMSAARS